MSMEGCWGEILGENSSLKGCEHVVVVGEKNSFSDT